jgi:precorrin-6A/cobalt-precorrin-6A reductase
MSWSSIAQDKGLGMQALEPARLLILGGTSEAARLADAATRRFGATLEVMSSLAGTTRNPASIAGTVRAGGFGGASGLAMWLRRDNTHMVVDATHPFAVQISDNAREACALEKVPRLVFSRAPWQPKDGDKWRNVSDLDTAAALLPDVAERAFLSVGSVRLGAFSGLPGVHLVVRMIDPPQIPVPLANCSVILGRGPFDVEAERALLRRERIDAVVSRNSGGSATYAKIRAARELDLPVVMIAPPAQEIGQSVGSIEGVLRWIGKRIALQTAAAQ